MDPNDAERRALADEWRELARQRLDELKKEYPGEFGGFLNEGVLFDHGLRLRTREQAHAETLFRELTKDMKLYSVPKKMEDFCILCANLLHVCDDRAVAIKPIVISMSTNEWTKDRYRAAGQFVRKAVHMLKDNGMINYKPGIQAIKRNSRIWPKPEFRMRFPDSISDPVIPDYMPTNFVVMKDSNGKIVDYKDNTETNRIRRILCTNDIVNRTATIQVHKRNSLRTLNTTLHAVFNVDWDNGGRLYTATEDGYQHLKLTSGKRIYINHEPTVELDYSGLHPRTLYAWEGRQSLWGPLRSPR